MDAMRNAGTAFNGEGVSVTLLFLGIRFFYFGVVIPQVISSFSGVIIVRQRGSWKGPPAMTVWSGFLVSGVM